MLSPIQCTTPDGVFGRASVDASGNLTLSHSWGSCAVNAPYCYINMGTFISVTLMPMGISVGSNSGQCYATWTAT